MDKKKKGGKYKDTARNLVVVVSVVLFFGMVFNVALAQNSFWDNVAERVAEKLFGSVDDSLSGDLGASGTRFPNGISADSTSPIAGQIRGTTSNITATTTLQEITLGTRYSKALTFTKGATTTPGGLVSILNTGADKICSRIESKITTGSVSAGALGIGSSFVFSYTTSTGALGTDSSVGATLIASTTIPTSTAPVFDSVSDKGGNIGTAGESFIWAAGEYILGQFDDAGLTNAGSTKTDFSTSSDAYTGMAGTMFVNCHTL